MSVSRKLWQEVVDRDRRAVEEPLRDVPFDQWPRGRRGVVCIVQLLLPSDAWRCKGRQTVDHVKWAPGMGVKADDRIECLVAMCWFHNVDEPPSKALRALEREYLDRLYPESSGTC